MSKEYNKITDMEVLKTYKEIMSDFHSKGAWIDNVPIPIMAMRLITSEYQIRKAYKNLAAKGYLELKKIPTHFEDYYNGLYDESRAILWTRAYVLTDKAEDYFKRG